MRLVYLSLALITILLFSAIASAQSTCPEQTTGADQSPCDGVVSLDELRDYIQLWYGCSSCYPDLYDAIGAWYCEPGCEPGYVCENGACVPVCTPDCAGKECGDDGCGGTCGSCDSGYYCDDGGCIGIPEGDVYYLDASATGADDGSSWEDAWTTIGKAVSGLGYGDTLLMRNGDYGTWEMESAFPAYTGSMHEPLPEGTSYITFKAAPGQKYVNFTRIEFGKANKNSLVRYILDGLRVRSIGGKAEILLVGCVGVKLLNITSTGRGTDSVDGIAIKLGNTRCNDVLIENCSISNYANGIKTYGYNLVVKDNHIYNMGSDFILADIGNNILVEGNVLHDTIPYIGAHPDGIVLAGTQTNVTIRGNTIYNQATQSIYCTGGSTSYTNVLIENNLIYNTNSNEFQIRNMHTSTIRQNTVIGDGGRTSYTLRFLIDESIGDSGSDSINVYNNLFLDDHNGYGGNDAASALEGAYHDHNIYVRGSAGDSEPNSCEYSSMGEALDDLFVGAYDRDYNPKWDSLGCIDNSGKHAHICNMSSTGSYVGAFPCEGPVSECETDEDCTDDGLFCTGTEACQSGQCVSSGNPCPSDGYSCTAEICNETAQSCSTDYDHLVCEDGNECTDDSCIGPGGDAGTGCNHSFNTGPCDDGDSCTSGDMCSSGACQPQANITSCTDDDGCCPSNCNESSDNDCSSLPEGYVSRWRFEGDAADSGPGGNTGTEHNNPQYVSGVQGNAIEFDGIDNYISVPHNDSIDFADEDFSVSLWYRTTSTKRHNYIYAKNYGTESTRWYGCTVFVDGNVVKCLADDGSAYDEVKAGDDFNDGQWHHLTYTRNTVTGRHIIYVDGQEEGNIADNRGSIANNGDLIIGGRSEDGTGYFFQGAIDEMMIYNRSLSSQEVQQIFEAQNS